MHSSNPMGKLFDVAIRLARDDAHANLLRGMVDQRLGRIDRAVDRLRKLVA